MSDESRMLRVVEAGRLPRVAPAFERVALVGLGVVGGSIGLALRQASPETLIVGVDDRKHALEIAVHLHAIDVGATDIIVAADVQAIVLSGTAEANAVCLGALPEYVASPCVVIAAGPLSSEMMACAQGLPSHLTFIGGGPQAGAFDGDVASAKADLFVGKTWVLEPVGAPGDVLERVASFVRSLGATPVFPNA